MKPLRRYDRVWGIQTEKTEGMTKTEGACATFSAGMVEKMSKITKFTNREGNGSTRQTKRQSMDMKRLGHRPHSQYA